MILLKTISTKIDNITNKVKTFETVYRIEHEKSRQYFTR